MATPLSRRSLLGSAVAAGTGLALGSSFWQRVYATPAPLGPGPYGPIDGRVPDENGLVLPAGFRSRVIARTGELVGGTGYVWPTAPDGQATFPTADGGWVLVTNSEWASATLLGLFGYQPSSAAALGAGVSAVRFAKNGRIVDAYRILAGSDINCAGGPTPWGTWLSGEEYDFTGLTRSQIAGVYGPAVADYFLDVKGAAGRMWECDPSLPGEGVPLDALGRFSHEAAAIDPATNHVYLTEDDSNGRWYRFRPTDANVGGRPDLSAGVLEAAVLADPNAVLTGSTAVSWVPVPDPTTLSRVPTRFQVPQATRFRRGEGMWFDGGTIYFTTTSDNRVWAYDCTEGNITVIYDRTTAGPSAPLQGADNVTVHPRSGDVFVAEDGGNLELVTITSPDDPNGRVAAPFCRFLPVDGVPQVATEVSGPVFDPSGSRLYVSSQRGIESSSIPSPQRGITYEITGPFRSQRRNAGR